MSDLKLVEMFADFDFCPRCSNGLDTGLECDKCLADWMPLQQAVAERDAAVKDAERYRWLTEDHADRGVRKARNRILDAMSVRSYSATSAAIDAAREREACAKVCESQLSSLENADRVWNGAVRRCVKEIRARGNV